MIQGTIKDITDTFFEAQRNSLAIEAGHIGGWEYDHLENNLVWNEEMCRLYEIDTNARLNCMDWVSGIHPEDRDRTVKAFESSLLGENRFNNQYRIVGKQTF